MHTVTIGKAARPSASLRRRLGFIAGGFTLVELLVVVGIMAILISILLPMLSQAQRISRRIKCASNLHAVGISLTMYETEYSDWSIPVGDWIPNGPSAPPDQGHWDTLGTEMPADPTQPWGARIVRPLELRWPHVVFGTNYPEVLHCPEDPQGGPLPAPYYSWHSYLLNKHLAVSNNYLVKFNQPSKLRSPGETIVMGEKIASSHDYYMEGTIDKTKPNNEYQTTVELARHGPTFGSNYLFLDKHVDHLLPSAVQGIEDPWDLFATNPTTAPTTGP